MCPSYRATGEEQHSTRGRAHLLWEMLAGSLRNEGFQSKAVHEALDLCLSCKACKTECPVQVDMAAYKSEFLAQQYKGRLHPLHHYIFGFADKLARFGSLTPALTNAILTGPITSPIVKRIAGVAQATQTTLARPALLPAFQRCQKSGCPILAAFFSRKGGRARTSVRNALARHLEQLLPPSNARSCRDRPYRSRLRGQKPERPHLLRPSPLRFRPPRSRPRLPRPNPRSTRSANSIRHALHLSRTKLRQRIQR